MAEPPRPGAAVGGRCEPRGSRGGAALRRCAARAPNEGRRPRPAPALLRSACVGTRGGSPVASGYPRSPEQPSRVPPRVGFSFCLFFKFSSRSGGKWPSGNVRESGLPRERLAAAAGSCLYSASSQPHWEQLLLEGDGVCLSVLARLV